MYKVWCRVCQRPTHDLNFSYMEKFETIKDIYKDKVLSKCFSIHSTEICIISNSHLFKLYIFLGSKLDSDR